MKKVLLILLMFSCIFSNAQMMDMLVPDNTVTHRALTSGDWFDSTIWSTGDVPGFGSIVLIPEGIVVEYEGSSDDHIFIIKVKGSFTITQSNTAETTKLIVDTFLGTMSSYLKVLAQNASDGQIQIIFTPFDIEAYKNGTESIWNTDAQNHYSDGAQVTKYNKEINGKYRYNDLESALDGDMSILSTPDGYIDDGSGVLGRYNWDPNQITLGMIVMGQTEIKGREKTTMIKLAQDASKGQKNIYLNEIPIGWAVGDSIIVSRGGNHDTPSNGNDVALINAINGNHIVTKKNLKKNHFGRAEDTLHCYVGNLMRNIQFLSSDTYTTRRAHFMAMHNDTNIQVRNTQFRNMGRTNKSEPLDDFQWDHWVAPKVDHCKISPLGQEVAVAIKNPIDEITNSRGRYSIHLHKTGSTINSNMAYVTGNVVWGNNGWAITQHDSYATIADNVIFDVTGAGIISESGSELGFWDDNLLVDIKKGHGMDVYQGVIGFDEYFFSGQGLAMKGRGVLCRNNVIVDANQAVGIMNMMPLANSTDRVDPLALAAFRPGFEIDQFPLDINGYSKEEDGILPVEISLLLFNTNAIWCNQGIKSIERDMGVNHESRSVFDGFKVWGANQGFSITYQADYTFHDVFISGKNPENSLGMYLWKHSHNHVFDNVKFADLQYGITVSKLVESGSGALKTRNNGFTQWFFLDLDTVNVDKFYEITKEDYSTTTVYDEHGDNPIHLPSDMFIERPTTFTILDSTDMFVDIAADKLRFTVDGIVTDRLSSYHFGIKQAPAQGSLRLDYPERVYQFSSVAKLEEYLSNNGLYQHPVTAELYFIIDELVPDRLTAEYTSFPMRIRIDNPPSGGIWSNPQMEPEENFDPENHIISRFATVSQSSTKTGLYFKDSLIDCSAIKAIDGNTNGRISVNYLQQGLVPIGSFSQSKNELEPWFDLDLGELKIIEFIDIWNSVELDGYKIEQPSAHFKNFHVMISDQPFDGLSLTEALGQATYQVQKDNSPTRLFSLNNLGVEGRYIRIQAPGTTKIKLAEVEVIGRSSDFECTTMVTNTDDSGIGSLRDAIACAMDGDTIILDAILENDTIQLTTSQLVIDKSISIHSTRNNIFVRNCTTINEIEIATGKTVDLQNFQILSDIFRNNGNLTCTDMIFKSKDAVIDANFINDLNAILTINNEVRIK